MESHQLVNQDSGNVEYYTPEKIVEAARQAMGGIELDPASSATANLRVKAKWFLDESVDGLKVGWTAQSVWLNHPFSREGNKLWVNKAIAEYEAGRAKQICMITYAATSEKWFAPLLRYPQVFLSPRTNYFLPDGSVKRGVTKGSVVTAIGVDLVKFAAAFQDLGVVKIAWGRE
jgi:hypothetical protein